MKFELAAGARTCGLLLSATGFDAKPEWAQAAFTHRMIRRLVAGVPIPRFVLAMLALMRFPLTQERMQQIRSQLERRRGVL
jgi:GPH family glycoside/pentoside/hexuronide:cation symporter